MVPRETSNFSTERTLHTLADGEGIGSPATQRGIRPSPEAPRLQGGELRAKGFPGKTSLYPFQKEIQFEADLLIFPSGHLTGGLNRPSAPLWSFLSLVSLATLQRLPSLTLLSLPLCLIRVFACSPIVRLLPSL